MNDYYSPAGSPGQGSNLTSSVIRAEFEAIQAGFNKLPVMAGNGGKPVRINLSETGLEASPSDYITVDDANGQYLRKDGGVMTGQLSANGGIVAVGNANQFIGKPADAAKYALFGTLDEAALRKLSILTLGSAAPAAYGANGGDTVFNVLTGRMVFSTADLERFTILQDGRGMFRGRMIVGGGAGVVPISTLTVQSAASAVGAATNIAQFDGLRILGTNASQGEDAITYQSGGGGGAGIGFQRDNSFGTLLAFYTSPTGGTSGSIARRMLIDQNGWLVLGAQNSPGSPFDLAVNLSGYSPNAGSAMRIVNAAGNGQSPIDFITNGNQVGRIRADYLGSMAYSAIGGGHAFFVGGDSGVGALGMQIDSNARVGFGVAPQVHLHMLGGEFRLQDSNGFMTGWNDAGSSRIGYLQFVATPGYVALGADGVNDLSFWTNGGERMRIMAISGALTERPSGLELGYKDIPADSTIGDGGVVTPSQRGKCMTGAYTGFTVPNNLPQGMTWAAYIDGAGTCTVSPGSGVTLRLAGTTSVGARTIAGRGFATFWMRSSTECVMGGAGAA